MCYPNDKTSKNTHNSTRSRRKSRFRTHFVHEGDLAKMKKEGEGKEKNNKNYSKREKKRL